MAKVGKIFQVPVCKCSAALHRRTELHASLPVTGPRSARDGGHLHDISRAQDEIDSDGLHDLVAAMIATMHEEGGIGIAAPQVSEGIRLAVIEIPADSTRYEGSEPFEMEVFVNPEVSVLDETEQEFWEGCLSVPDLRGKVPRPRKVRVDYLGISGDRRSMTAGSSANLWRFSFARRGSRWSSRGISG